MLATELISLELMREHIRADQQQTSDALLTAYANAAFEHCLKACDEPKWLVPSDVPANVVAAMLLFIADFNENREAQGISQMFANRMANELLFSSRNWYGTTLPGGEVLP